MHCQIVKTKVLKGTQMYSGTYFGFDFVALN